MIQKKLLNILHEQFNLKGVTLKFLRNGGGMTYTVEDSERKYLLKVIGNPFERTARQSVAIIRYLEAHDFSVPRTIMTKDGQPMLETEFDGQKAILILQEYIDGKEPDLKLRAEEVGALVGGCIIY